MFKESKAEEKYTDPISKGNASVFTKVNNDKKEIIVHIGNIPPKEKIIIISEFVQPLKQSKNYEYYLQILDDIDLPILKGQNDYELKSDTIKCSLEIKTKIKIEKVDIIFS